MSELIAPVVGLIGVILGVGISEFRRWRESKEQYRILTFEKRLTIHQEALSFCYKVHHCLFQSKAQEEKNNIIDEMEKWWENDCLLLDEKSRRKMLDLIGDARDYANGFAESQSQFMRTFGETIQAISQGIGIRHVSENYNLKKEEKTFQG